MIYAVLGAVVVGISLGLFGSGGSILRFAVFLLIMACFILIREAPL